MQQKNTKKFKLNFEKTFKNLKAEVEKLVVVEPAKTEGGKPTVKRLIKGNVYSTLKDVYRLHMMERRKSGKPGTIALRTKNPSLAKVTQNSPRTIQRHIEKLIKHGLIQAKARLGHGIQLLLNAAIVVYDEVLVTFAPQKVVELAQAPQKTVDVDGLLRAAREKMLQNAHRTPPKNPDRTF